MPKHTLTLQGFQYSTLFHSEGLANLDQAFLSYLKVQDPQIEAALRHYRTHPLSVTEISKVIVSCAPFLDTFLSELFQIQKESAVLQEKTLESEPIFAFKKYYVLRLAKRRLEEKVPSFKELDDWLQAQIIEKSDRELGVAQFGQSLLSDEAKNQPLIERVIQWCIAAMTTVEGKAAVRGWTAFHLPKKLDYEKLVSLQKSPHDLLGRSELDLDSLRARDGFSLTDTRMSRREVMREVDYCVFCHKTDGDFCSKGFPVRKGNPAQGVKINPLGEILTGCPLDEKISEMHLLKKRGFSIGALATVMIDNPLCPLTGHRICNDCMKACIYQKQEPVNIPQTETRILTDVLNLPWGVEIYDLLTRWNPLRREQTWMKPYNGLKVLVMGMGPAGVTLAHHLLMEGCAVVGMDGLKIEPLPESLMKNPVYRYADLEEDLAERRVNGFGGVAEYGITVRWDKNFLKLVYLVLMRRAYFQVFGNVRFGGTLTI